MKHLHKLIIVFSLFLGCACTNSALNSPNTLKKTTESVVKIKTIYISKDKITHAQIQQVFFATGFSINSSDGRTAILTNKHVCDMQQKAKYIITTSNGTNAEATFIRYDNFADICLLKTNVTIPPLELAQQNVGRGDRVYTIGNPNNVYPLIVDGIVSGYSDTDMVSGTDDGGSWELHFRSQLMSVPTYFGSSGSPVLNIRNEVVGIVFAVGRKEHIAYFVPINEVHRFLDISEYVIH